MSDDQFEHEPSTVEVIGEVVVEAWHEGGWDRLLVAMLVFGLTATAVMFIVTVAGLVLGW